MDAVVHNGRPTLWVSRTACWNTEPAVLESFHVAVVYVAVLIELLHNLGPETWVFVPSPSSLFLEAWSHASTNFKSSSSSIGLFFFPPSSSLPVSELDLEMEMALVVVALAEVRAGSGVVGFATAVVQVLFLVIIIVCCRVHFHKIFGK